MPDRTILFVLCSSPATPDDRHLLSLARFLGVEVCALGDADEASQANGAVHLAATCQSLEAFCRSGGLAWLRTTLSHKGSTLFLTGLSPACRRLFAEVLPGVDLAVDPPGARGERYEVANVPSHGMRPFAGLTFSSAGSGHAGVVTIAPSAGVIPLVSVGGRSCYVQIAHGPATWFLLACERVLDIDAPAGLGERPLDRFLEFVPFLGYLRAVFGSLCWHNVRPCACLIIDDPLLRRSYGFLDLDRLESHMARSRFSTNIAFIPWNCRRTDRAVAKKFMRPDRRFSISVHGCDHTEAEFAATDERWLRQQARRALSHMAVHQQLTGIAHNRVMVFPQGEFSKASLRALEDEGFLAAVNSTIHPVDAAGDVTVRDLLDMAVVRFDGVPLFPRHYPERLEELALDVFLGKQVLLVEHHGFFKQGYEGTDRFAAFVNRICPDVDWTDLEEACGTAHLVREVPGDGMHVRAFGMSASLRNPRAEPLPVRVFSRPGRNGIASITWNGEPLPFDAALPAGAESRVTLAPGEEGEIRFKHRASPDGIVQLEPTLVRRGKVFVRRHLCEVRDEYLARLSIPDGIVRAAKNLLPRM